MIILSVIVKLYNCFQFHVQIESFSSLFSVFAFSIFHSFCFCTLHVYRYHMSGLYLKLKNIFGSCPRYSLSSVTTKNIKMIVRILCYVYVLLPDILLQVTRHLNGITQMPFGDYCCVQRRVCVSLVLRLLVLDFLLSLCSTALYQSCRFWSSLLESAVEFISDSPDDSPVQPSWYLSRCCRTV